MAELSGSQPVAADVPGPEAAQPDLPDLRSADHGQAAQQADGQTHQNDGTITVKAKPPILKRIVFAFALVVSTYHLLKSIAQSILQFLKLILYR